MDALTALRTAITEGRAADIQYDANSNPEQPQLVIDGTPYAALQETAFMAKMTRKRYKLLPLWLQYMVRDKQYGDYMAIGKQYGVAVVDLVLIPEKKILLDYLSGLSSAPDNVDSSFLKGSVAVEGGAGGAAGAAGAAGVSSAGGVAVTGVADADLVARFVDETVSVEQALKREIPLRTRASVLECGTKMNLRDFTFARFALQDSASASGANGATAAAQAAALAAAQQASSDPKRHGPIVVSASGIVGQKRSRGGVGGGGGDDNPFSHIRGTPIIIVPSGPTSLINLYNAAAFLQEGRFVPPIEARAAWGSEPKPVKVTIRRPCPAANGGAGGFMQYYVIDNVDLLKTRPDWEKVVAVFAQGPDWQFKGWRWGRTPERPDITPAEIFDRSVGFHLQYEGDPPHENIPKWNVKTLAVAKLATKRYSDAAVSNKVWELVDNWMRVHRPSMLLPKQPEGAAAGAAGAGAAGVTA